MGPLGCEAVAEASEGDVRAAMNAAGLLLGAAGSPDPLLFTKDTTLLLFRIIGGLQPVPAAF